MSQSSCSSLQIEAFTSPEAFTDLEAEWRALMARSAHAHPFYDPAWHAAWWRNFGAGELHVYALRDEAGALTGVAPFVLSEGGRLRLTGGDDLSDYLDIIAADGAHLACWRAVLAAFDEPDAPDWRELSLRGIPEASPTIAAVEELTGGAADVSEEEVCPVIPLPDSWDEYAGMLAPRDERDLRRKIRKANMEAGLEYERTESADALAADLEDFIALHALSQQEKADFWNADRRAFFEDVTGAMLGLGCLDLSVMRVDGHAVAANLSFDYGDRIYLYNSGFDPVEHELSAGLVLLAHNVEEAIRAGRASFDMLRGDEAYKYRFGAQDERVMRVHIERSAR